MGNQQACQCCGAMDYAADDAEVDVNGDIHKANKSTSASLPIQSSSDMDDNSFAAGRYPRAPSRNGSNAFASGILEETRDEAGEACCSERGAAHGTASRYRKKPSSIMVDGQQQQQNGGTENPAATDNIADAGSFSSISDAGTASLLADPRQFDMSRVAPPSQSLSMDSYGDHTDYAICREMMHLRLLAETRDDCQDESRDDV